MISERNEREKTTKEEGQKIRSYSRSEKNHKRHLNNYAIRIIIISLYDIFNSIGFIYKYTSISRLILYTNYITDLSGGFCLQNWRTELLIPAMEKKQKIRFPTNASILGPANPISTSRKQKR